MVEFPFDGLWPDERFEAVVRLVHEGFTRRDVPYAFIGSFAILTHGIPRDPKDLDMLVCGAERGRAVELLRELGFEEGRLGGTDDGGDHHQHFELRSASGPSVDLIEENRSAGDFREWANGCPRLEAFRGALTVVVASPADIAYRKVRRMYVRDILDIQDLLQRYPLRIDMSRMDDLNRVRDADIQNKWAKVKRALVEGVRWEPPEPPQGGGRTIFDAMCAELDEPEDDLRDLRDPRR
ncbi:MAG: hypothetical protein HY925_01320 [Elusimicrobia bacterium]|nr:hypothetical protein [Elusimicrobiota bacterium]